MSKISSVKDLEKIRTEASKGMKARCQSCGSCDGGTKAPKADAEYAKGEYDVSLCQGTSCLSSGAQAVKDALLAELEKRGLGDKINMVKTGCNGYCAAGPIITVFPKGILYLQVKPEDIPELVEEHFVQDKPVERLMYKDPETKKAIPCYEDLPYFARQEMRVLRNLSVLDVENIDEYIARDGYFGLAKALEMSSEEVVKEVLDAGLRGRGGAGFPTGLKWKFCANEQADQKYILCNADEGDPGAFMDRVVIEADPHAVLEGMMIGAKAIGATKGFIYCRAEYPLALERLRKAIDACHEKGLLGENILGTGFCFELELAQGSGAFVCGEETSLMRSIEGKRGEPRPRPPFPAQKGLWEKPSVLNNVETFATVPGILRNGVDWFRSAGTEKSPGTKIFALAGAIENGGLVEVPIGTPLGELIYDIGGGIPNGKNYKAAQIGGPSGGCIPREHLNVPLDYESLSELGAIIGSGGLVVMDEDTCMVDVARFFLEFVQEESCGKCVPCRVGTKRMLEILERICDGQGKMSDLDDLVELGEFIKDSSLCGLGQTAPNPVLSTLRHFRHEYIQHIVAKQCEAGVCPNLVRAPCQSACPAGVDIPGFVSLVGEERYAEALLLHRERNPFASVCARVCFHTCEDKCRRSAIDTPVAVRGVKRFMADQEVILQVPEALENEENAKRKIAIIGAGPAGLSCAYFLARLGYAPKVFEAEPRPGGMLVQAIPAYRLPREQLAREVRMIENMGVEIITNSRLGKEFTLQSLKDEGYDAVCVAVGAARGSKVKIKGSDSEGVVDSLDFLRTYNIRGSVPVGKNVVVIGGGNAAIDAARTSMRLGSENVTVVYRRMQDQMPAYAEEIEEALEEGVQLITLASPTEFITADGKVKSVKCKKMQLGDFDRSGRRRPVDSDEEIVLDADQVIMAVGQELCPEILEEARKMGLAGEKDWWLPADAQTGQTKLDWVFSGGDMVRGPSSVVDAIADGERAAVGIDKFLTGEAHAFWREEQEVVTDYDPDSEPVPYPRDKMNMLDLERRRHNFTEVEQSWNQAVAIRQAKRCLRCDYGKTVCGSHA